MEREHGEERLIVPSTASRANVTLNERAIESLEFIRHTMARSAPFTAVPGWGGVGMGAIATVAAAAGSRAADGWVWLGVWLVAAAVAAPIGFFAMLRKAKRYGLSIWSAAGRRFAQGFVPALGAGAVLTFALALHGQFELLPAMWLLLYGAGVLAGSTASVPVLAWMGGATMLLGLAAVFTPPAWRDIWLGAGFGGLQIVFGLVIARNHGG
jgi:hypothetical protein